MMGTVTGILSLGRGSGVVRVWSGTRPLSGGSIRGYSLRELSVWHASAGTRGPLRDNEWRRTSFREALTCRAASLGLHCVSKLTNTLTWGFELLTLLQESIFPHKRPGHPQHWYTRRDRFLKSLIELRRNHPRLEKLWKKAFELPSRSYVGNMRRISSPNSSHPTNDRSFNVKENLIKLSDSLDSLRAKPPFQVSFCGCGWLKIYHIGVVATLRNHLPASALSSIQYLGSSTGSIIALFCALDVPTSRIVDYYFNVLEHRRTNRFSGPVGKVAGVVSAELRAIIEQWEQRVGRKAHEFLSGRLFLSVTSFPDMTNVLVSEFPSNDHLLNMIHASSYIPIYNEKPPLLVNGRLYIDGCFSRLGHQPVLDSRTFTVSPYSGEADISPPEDIPRYPGIYRLFPPRSRDALMQIMQDGERDVKRWLDTVKKAGFDRIFSDGRKL